MRPARLDGRASSACRTASTCRCAGCSARTSGSPAGWRRCASYLPELLDLVTSGDRRPRSGLRHAAAARRGRRGLPRDGRAHAPSRSTSRCEAMADLVLGPLLRYVDHDSATIWVETDDTCAVTSRRTSGPGRPHVRGARSPLRAGGGRGPGAGHHLAVRRDTEGHGRRRTGCGPRRDTELDLPPVGDQHPEGGQAAAARVRVLPHQRRATTARATPPTAWTPCVPTRWRWPASPTPGERLPWPDMVVFLGDQVYADETSQRDARVHRLAA